jgi:porphobilinogen synthase
MRTRPRRLRISKNTRQLVRETEISSADFVLPIFVSEGSNKREEIASMPGFFRTSSDYALKTCEEAAELGIPAVALFPHLGDDKKDSYAKESLNKKGLLCETVRAIKKRFPELVVITDVAMDPYSSDGHDGVVKRTVDQSGAEKFEIDNDESLEILANMALVQAEAGADFVAPSDMMDGRIGFIRDRLDTGGFKNVGIIAYSAKYASAFYGPFRDALESAPRFGDKKTYQMDPGNSREAIREVRLDLAEGADMVMVKPALAYLDVIKSVRNISAVPVVAYNVSGEYAMIKLAAQHGLLDEKRATLEVLTAIKRAGADLIFTYHALTASRWLNER